MANPEYVELVKKGWKAIAAWRKKHPDVGLDLSYADLMEADLSGADLSGADLSRADLSRAGLRGANLSGANLGRANLCAAELIGTDLRGANLVEADLSWADLSRANLRGADLSWADLSRANLRGADMSKARFGYTVLGDVDLSETKGLETAEHSAPSTIGVDTLLESRGKIPEKFLRGCGVPKVWIEYLPSLTGAGIEFYSCFISHSSRDGKFAKRLHERMQGEGLRVWYAPEDMKGGRKSIEQIDQAIRVYDKFLLVLSAESMKSNWVRTEIKLARKREKAQKRQILFPIRLVSFKAIRDWECFDSDAGRDLAEDVREYHIPDFSDWKNQDPFEKAFKELLRDLRKGEGGGQI